MSNKITETDIEAEMRSIWNETGNKDFHPVKRHLAYCALFEKLKVEMKRCYKLLDDADNAMSRYGDEEEHQDIDSVCDAYEAVCNALAGQGRW